MDGSLHEVEAPAVAKVYGDLLAGVSLRRCAQYLNDEGILTNGTRKGQKGSHGKEWTTQSLRPVLLNARNAGIRTYKGEEIGRAGWEQLVSEEVYRATVRLLTAPGRDCAGGKGGIGNRLNLLTGLVTCGKCGGSMSSAVKGKGTRIGEYKVYVCRKNRCVSTQQEWADSVVVRKVIDRVEEWKDALKERSAPQQGIDTAALHTESVALESRKAELAELFIDGAIDRNTLTAGNARADQRLADIAEQLAEAAMERHGFNISDTEALWEWTTADDGEFDVNKVRPVIDRVVRSIALYPRGKGKTDLRYGEHLVIEFNEP